MSDQKNATDVVAPMSGFVFGLLGAPITRVDTVDDKTIKTIVGYRFEATGKDANGKAVSIAKYSDVEAPYPTNDEAAKRMAKDCRFTIVRLVDGKYIKTELKGLAAAVAIARDGRPVETLRGRVRNRKISENQLREAAMALYGFSAGDTPDIVVDREGLAALMADETLSPVEKFEAMQKFLVASGVKVS